MSEDVQPSAVGLLGLTPIARAFLTSELRRRRGLVALIFLGGAVYAFLEVTGVGLVFPLIAVIMRPDAVHAVPVFGRLMDRFGLVSPRQLTFVFILAIAVVMAIKNGYMVLFYWWQARATAQWKAELSRRMMRLYVLSDLRMHMEKSPGVMIRNLSYAPIAFDQYIMPMLTFMVNGSVALGIAILLAFALPWQTLFSIGALATGAGALFLGTRRRFTAIGLENHEIYRQRSIVLQQSIGAIRESRILGRESYFLEKFGEIEHRSFERFGHYNFLASLPGLALETVIIASVLLIIAHTVFISGGGPSGLAMVGLLAAAMFRLLPMIIRMTSNLQLLNMGLPSLELVAQEIAACEPRVRVPNVRSDEKLPYWNRIELRGVGYTYPDGTRALHGVTATIERSEFVGITGPSGAGKTTLMMILLGLVEPTEGMVYVDGRPFSDPDVVRLWQNGIGYVPQGLFLVDGTLAENVAFGSSTPDPIRVRRALDAAQLGAYVDSQPEGINAPVGDYGERLSGGQKQRVVIARALYRNPDVIAFDEATSTLDAIAERALTDHLVQFKTSKCMFAIAHRLGTIQHCDKILYLEAGTLQGFAPFRILKEQNAAFNRLATLSNL
jgi:ATP-binding cassette subfamily C protein